MTDQAANVLSVRNVDLGYGSLKVVFDASLTVGSGELVGLIGGCVFRPIVTAHSV